jgi:ferredoxin-type protein NapH
MQKEMKRNPVFVTEGSIWKSLLITLPMILLIMVFISNGEPDLRTPDQLGAFLVTLVFLVGLFFGMVFTGKTDRYRAAGFITLSLFFALTFIVNLIKVRGSMTFNEENFLSCEIPFCHIVTTMIIIPIALTNSIIFPGSIINGFASIASMLVIVIGVSFAIGRGFCSWGCFYGGWDDGTSRIFHKPKIKKINPAFRWMSFSVLLVVALSSAMLLNPTYCDWLCPFKTVTEFEKVTSFTVLLKTIAFISLFAGLVIILPVLTKKRIQCATFCPMGALLSLSNKINAFDVRINKEECSQCGKCVNTCPTLSLSSDEMLAGSPSLTCMKCGKCIDVCSKRAIHYHIKGTPVGRNYSWARNLFLFPSFLLLVIFIGGPMQTSILLLINLIKTGSLL